MFQSQSLLPLRSLLFFFNAANTIIISFLSIYLEYKGLDGAQIGWILAIGPFAALVSQPFWGYMSDKYRSVKRSLLICLGGLLIGSLLFFNSSSFLLMIFTAVIFYFFTSPIGGLGDSLSQRKANELNISFGSIRMWGSTGFALAALFIGHLLDQIGMNRMIYPYLIFGALAFVSCLFLPDVRGEGVSIKFSDIKRLFSHKPYTGFLCALLLVTITHRANDSFLGLYLSRIGASDGLVGWAWFAGVASEALVFAFSRFWFRRYNELVFIIAAGLLYALRWTIYSFIHNPVAIVGLQFMHGLCFGVFYLASLSFVTRLIPKDLLSTGHLMFYAVYFGLSGIVGSLVGGSIIEHSGGQTLYLILGIGAFAGSIILTVYYIAFRGIRRQPMS